MPADLEVVEVLRKAVLLEVPVVVLLLAVVPVLVLALVLLLADELDPEVVPRRTWLEELLPEAGAVVVWREAVEVPALREAVPVLREAVELGAVVVLREAVLLLAVVADLLSEELEVEVVVVVLRLA